MLLARWNPGPHVLRPRTSKTVPEDVIKATGLLDESPTFGYYINSLLYLILRYEKYSEL